LEGKLGIKVYLERDTNFLFYKDVQAKNLPVKGIAVGIYVGTGVGNAIFVDGKPLLGKDGVVGEIGHIPFLGGEDICGCGNKGCAECYASGRHLSALRDQYFKETVMDDLFSEHRENSVLKDFVDKIACVVATVINILNPEYIILGGGVIGMKDFPKEYLEKCIRIHTRKPYPEQNLSIYYADDTVEDGVRGAIFYVLDNCL
jgi:allose kinase